MPFIEAMTFSCSTLGISESTVYATSIQYANCEQKVKGEYDAIYKKVWEQYTGVVSHFSLPTGYGKPYTFRYSVAISSDCSMQESGSIYCGCACFICPGLIAHSTQRTHPSTRSIIFSMYYEGVSRLSLLRTAHLKRASRDVMNDFGH